MKKLHLLLFVCAFFAANLLNAQQRIFPVRKDSAPFDNRYYKQELGLNISDILHGNIGGALVWKIRDDRSSLVPVGYSHFWRLQAGLYSNHYTGSVDSFTYLDYHYENYNPARGNTSFWVMAGRERVNYHNRFNFYYGWELGPNYRYDRGNYYDAFRVYNPDRTEYYWVTVEQKEKRHNIGATVAGFVGVKYRITPRISLSFESAVTAFYKWTKKRQTIQSNHMDVVSSTNTYHEFGGNIQYLRFITLNYHFKHY